LTPVVIEPLLDNNLANGLSLFDVSLLFPDNALLLSARSEPPDRDHPYFPSRIAHHASQPNAPSS
jgi:hypothetical protein